MQCCALWLGRVRLLGRWVFWVLCVAYPNTIVLKPAFHAWQKHLLESGNVSGGFLG